MNFKLLLILLIATNCYAIDYSDAFSHARQAFLIQSGVQDNLNKFGQYGLTQLHTLGLDTEFGATAFAYRTYRDKSGTINLGNGKRMTINLNSVVFTFPINWK